MRGAVFRPRRLSKKQARFSLDICSLSELVDQYHTHETTIRHDKVYALLGMSSDDISTAGLEPDYKLAWGELLRRLVRFLLGNRVTIETIENTEVAVIKAKGCVLGRVWSINATQGWETEVVIGLASECYLLEKGIYAPISCSLPSLPKAIKRGDLVCLLEGSQKPIIIRFYKGHFAVVMIGAVPRGQSREKLLDVVQSVKHFSRDLLLAWNLGNCLVESQDVPAFELTRSSDKSDLASRLDDFTCLWNVALILNDAPVMEEEDREEKEEMFGVATKLHKAILEMTNLHISVGDLSGLTPLAFSAKNGHVELASMLLAEGGNSLSLVDRNGQTPLSHAAEQGHLALVKLLLESGHPGVLAAGDDGQTPLLRAAACGQEEVVKLLVKTDQIDVNAIDISEWTPLSIAAKNGHEGVVKLLLNEDKCDVHWKVPNGYTPLMSAAENGHEVIVKILLDKGVDVGSRAWDGRTPLWLAAWAGHEAVVKVLLDYKADVNAKDMDGDTPLSIATEEGYEAIIKLLRRADADRGNSGKMARSKRYPRKRKKKSMDEA